MAIYENVNGVIKTLAESGGGLRVYTAFYNAFKEASITCNLGSKAKCIVLIEMINSDNQIIDIRGLNNSSSFSINDGSSGTITFTITFNDTNVVISRNKSIQRRFAIMVFY